MCTPLAGSIRSKPSPPRGLARDSRGCSGLLLARRSQTLRSGPGVTEDISAMSTPLSRLVTRVAYGARQLPRVAWYVGHSLALRQLSEATRRREGQKVRRRPRTNLPVPDRNQIYADIAALFMQDLANVEAGIYPIPVDHDGSLATLLHRSRLFFEDLPAIHQRRVRRDNTEVLTEETRGKRPR